MQLKKPLLIRASTTLALLLVFPYKAFSGPTEIKVKTPVGEGGKPVIVHTGQTSGIAPTQLQVPTIDGGILPIVGGNLALPVNTALSAASRIAPTNRGPNAASISPAPTTRRSLLSNPSRTAVPGSTLEPGANAADGQRSDSAPKVGDERFQEGLQRVTDGTGEMAEALDTSKGGGNVISASLIGGRLFDNSGSRRPGNFADTPAGGDRRANAPRRSGLQRARQSDDAFHREFVRSRIPEDGESGKEGVEFDDAAVEKRVEQLNILSNRMETILQDRYQLSETEAQDLWREILKEHPTAFGYHIPEHSHQPLMVTESVLNSIAALGDTREEVQRQNEIDLKAAAAAHDEFNTKPMPQKYNGDRSAPKISKYRQIQVVERELADAGPAAAHLEWMFEALKELKFEQLQLNTKLTQANVLQALLDNDVTREDKAILDIATILHDVDPEREEGTLARVAFTLQWLDTPRGEAILARLAQGHFPGADAAKLSEIKEKVKAYILATDFQYEGKKKDAIWPDFIKQVGKAWGITDLKAVWGAAEPDEFPADVPASQENQTVRKVMALAHLLRISDQFGAYTKAASLTPDDAAEGFKFTDWMVRMLKREMRRTPFVPEFLQGLPADGLLAGTFNFLTQREPGSPTFDDKVEGAAKPLSIAGITNEVLNTARNFRSAYAPEKFKPSDFWASPEDAEAYLLSGLPRLPSWFQVGQRPQQPLRQRLYDDTIAAYLMTRPDGLYRTNREQVITALEKHGIEIDYNGAPPKELPPQEQPEVESSVRKTESARAPPARDDIGRALKKVRKYIVDMAAGIKISDNNRHGLMVMGLEEEGIKLESTVGRAVEAELFPTRAQRGQEARSAIAPEFVNHASLIVELAGKFGLATEEVERIIKEKPILTALLATKANARQARRQLVFVLQRDRVESMTSKFPDNAQGRFLQAMGQEILTPGGKSIEEILRAGAFAYVDFAGKSVRTTSVGRDPDVQSSDYVFYILLEADGRWTINGYRKNNERVIGVDQEYVEVLQNWLKAGLKDQVQFSPRRI